MKHIANLPELSVLIPIFNEEKIIKELYDRLTASALSITLNYQLIFINDGSTDGSLSQIMYLASVDPKVYYINFSRNFGHQIAVTAGLDYCTGKAVVIIDGDLQDPPEVICELYAKFKEGYDVVYAQRKARKGESYFKKMSAALFYRLLKRLTTFEIPVDTGDFRLIDQKVVHLLRQMPEKNKFLRGQIAWLGFNQTSVQYIREERKHGRSNYPLSKMIAFALDGITSFSDRPLKFVTNAGIFLSFISFLIIIYAIYSHFILNQTITGWTSLIISTSFLGGIQLLSLGVIGEYISRINRNILNRPLYIIQNSNLERP